MGFFCFGVSWLNVSIHQFGGASLGVSYLFGGLAFGLPCTLSNAFHVFSAAFSGAKCGHFCRMIWTLTEFLRGWVFTGLPWLQFGYTQIDSPFSALRRSLGSRG